MGVRVSEIIQFTDGVNGAGGGAAGSAGVIVTTAGAANVTGTLKLGKLYRVSATGAAAVRFGATAAALSNGNFAFYAEPTVPVVVRVPHATVNVIRVGATDVSVYFQQIDEESAIDG
jgi:hypothetical protein